MANEELVQRGYLVGGALKGTAFGLFEELNLGATSVTELRSVGLDFSLAPAVNFPFKEYKPPKTLGSCKPDRVLVDRRKGTPSPVAIAEHKGPTKMRSAKELTRACEQGLFAAALMGVRIALATDGAHTHYIDVEASLMEGFIKYFPEPRDLNPAVLEDLLEGTSLYTTLERPHCT